MDKKDPVVTAEGYIKGLNGTGKNTVKIKFKKKVVVFCFSRSYL